MLVDAVTEHEPGRRLVAVKNVTVNEEFFQGHFPGAPLMPGVLMIEALTQVAAILLLERDGASPTDARLSARRQRREVPPSGRAGRSAAARNHAVGRAARALARAQATAYVGDQLVAEARAAARRSCPIGREIDPTAIVHPRRAHRRRHDDRPACDDRARRHASARLPDRRVGGHRRLDRDRRRDRDLSVRVDRPGAAGPEVQGRRDAARRSAGTTSSASSSRSTAAPRAAAA